MGIIGWYTSVDQLFLLNSIRLVTGRSSYFLRIPLANYRRSPTVITSSSIGSKISFISQSFRSLRWRKVSLDLASIAVFPLTGAFFKERVLVLYEDFFRLPGDLFCLPGDFLIRDDLRCIFLSASYFKKDRTEVISSIVFFFFAACSSVSSASAFSFARFSRY